MAYVREHLFNPRWAVESDQGATDPNPYEFQVNHWEEEGFGKTRNITHTGLTGGVGQVRQQGSPDPMVMTLMGTILNKKQHKQFIRFFNACSDSTVQYRDFEGNVYEVLITDYTPIRRHTMRNPRDPSIPLHYYTYTLKMEVLRFVSGEWVGTPTY